MCNDGSEGAGCETDAACQGGLTCELVLNLGGFLEIQSCSECASDSDCPVPLVCDLATAVRDPS